MEVLKLKELLESFKYDNQFLEEKMNEISHVKKSFAQDDLLYHMTKQYEEDQVKRIVEKKHFLESSFLKLRQPFQALMYMKYISLLSFDEIADKMQFSKSRIYQLHKKAITSLSNIIDTDGNLFV